MANVEALSNIFIPNGKKAALSNLLLKLRSVNATNLHLLVHLTEPILTRTDGQFRPTHWTLLFIVYLSVYLTKRKINKNIIKSIHIITHSTFRFNRVTSGSTNIKGHHSGPFLFSAHLRRNTFYPAPDRLKMPPPHITAWEPDSCDPYG